MCSFITNTRGNKKNMRIYIYIYIYIITLYKAKSEQFKSVK